MLKKDLKFITKRITKYTNKKRSKELDLKKGGIVYLFRKNIKTKRPSDKLDYIKLEPFKIKDRLRLVTFRLDLLEGMRIYSVFYISLLELVLDNAKLEPIQIDEKIQTPIYEVNKIIGYKEMREGHYYLVY